MTTKQQLTPPDGTLPHAYLRLAMTYTVRRNLWAALWTPWNSAPICFTLPFRGVKSEKREVSIFCVLPEICSESQIQIRTITLVTVNQKWTVQKESHIWRCWAVSLDLGWTGLNETRETRQLIQCKLVITKTNSKPWHQWSYRLPSDDPWALEILSRRDMGADKNPFNQLCNQVIAIKSLSLGRYHCVTASSIIRSFECLLVVLLVHKRVCGSAPSLSSRFYGSLGNKERHALWKLNFLTANWFKHNMITLKP